MKNKKLNYFTVALCFCFTLSLMSINIKAGDGITKNDDINFGFSKLNISKSSASESLFNYMRRSNYNKRLRSGVTFKLAAFIPGQDYGIPESFKSSNTTKYSKTGIDFQIGTHIYIGPSIADMFRFGLDFSWIDFSYSNFDRSDLENSFTMNFAFIGMGPIAAFSPNKNIAVDAYFKFLPMYSLAIIDYANNDYINNQGGLAITKLFGVGFRFRALYVGLEKNWGKIDYKCIDSEDNSDSYNIDSGKCFINNTRLFFGVKL